MANSLPNYYAQETLRMAQRPQPELQSLLSELGLSHALPDSSRIDGDMAACTTSYQQIKDACRRDAGTFYRAFKKWTGITPQHFRQRES